jgi:hypothetical protein
MAKKRVAKKKTGAAAIKVVNGDEPKKGPGLGKKFCLHCGMTIAARAATCPECKAAIAPKKKAAAKKKNRPTGIGTKPPHSTNGATDPLNAAAALLMATGGIVEAKATLDRLAAIAKLC